MADEPRVFGMNDWREQCLQGFNGGFFAEAEVLARVAHIARQMGFDHCSIGVRHQLASGDRAQSWHSTYPEAWQKHYFEHDFLNVDPVIGAALRSSLPVVWDDQRDSGNHEFWESADHHGIRHGWAMSLRGPRDDTLLISLARSHQAMAEQERAEKEPYLLWLAHSALAMLAPDTDVANGAELSSREKEVLRWALAGKTSEETAIILGIATRTVNFHVSVAVRKLDVVNKTQAVAKVVALHLLD